MTGIMLLSGDNTETAHQASWSNRGHLPIHFAHNEDDKVYLQKLSEQTGLGFFLPIWND